MFSFIADKLNVKNLGEMLAPTLTPEQELHAAIETGMLEKVTRFLDEAQMDPNTPSPTGNLPIHTASYNGRIAVVEFLLARGVDVNRAGPRENTPLHFAASQGHEDMVKFLINSGANPALRNRSGKTPYDIAKGDRIRQYLLPLQFRHEDPTQAASYLPPGITPSVDPLAPKPDIAPPPIGGDYSMMGGPPTQPQMPQNPLYAAATHSAIPRGGAGSRITRGEYRPIQADGFGSSVGNEALTAKFGNTREIKVTAPPPSLGAGAGLAPTLPPPSDGSNPYAAQPRAGAPSPPAGGYSNYAPPPQQAASGPPNNNFARGPPQFKIFNPKLAAQNAASAAPVNPGAFGSGAPGVNAAAGAPRGAYMQSVPLENDFQGEEVNLSANASVLQ